MGRRPGFLADFGQIWPNFVGRRPGFSAEIWQIWWVGAVSGGFRANRSILAILGGSAGKSAKTEALSPFRVDFGQTADFGRFWARPEFRQKPKTFPGPAAQVVVKAGCLHYHRIFYRVRRAARESQADLGAFCTQLRRAARGARARSASLSGSLSEPGLLRRAARESQGPAP